MSFLGFPQMPKLDGPDGLIGTAQKLAASFEQIVGLLQSIDRRLGVIEREAQRQGIMYAKVAEAGMDTPQERAQ